MCERCEKVTRMAEEITVLAKLMDRKNRTVADLQAAVDVFNAVPDGGRVTMKMVEELPLLHLAGTIAHRAGIAVMQVEDKTTLTDIMATWTEQAFHAEGRIALEMLAESGIADIFVGIFDGGDDPLANFDGHLN